MSNSQVIESFLVQLGYKVDDSSRRRFEDGMTKAASLFAGLAKTAAVTAVSVGVAIDQAAKRLDSLYFTSKRVGASAGNIEALKYAIEQLGGTSEGAMGSLEGLAKFMREYGEGAEQKLRGLGVQTRDANGKLRDTVDIYKDLAAVLKSMKSTDAAQHAALFGTDDMTLQAIRGGDLLKYISDYHEQMKAAGIDMEQAAKTAHDYAEMIRKLELRFSALGMSLANKALPYLRDFTTELVNNLDAFNRWLTTHDLIDLTGNISKAPTPKSRKANWFDKILPESWVSYLTTGDASVPVSGPATDPVIKRIGGRGSAGGGRVVATPKTGAPNTSDLFANLERQYGLPAGLLDRIWQQESGRGRNMLSPKGAMGHFQFMPATAKQYGVTDPNDLTQSATGAAKYLRDLMGMFGGDITKAVAAYNWGPGNLQRYGLGSSPAETRGYLRNVLGADAGAGRGFSQQNTININVTTGGNPNDVARAVGAETRSVLQDVTRAAAGVTR